MYMVKEPICSKKRWNASKNLINPPAKTRDGRFTKRKALELARDTDNAREYEKYFPDYNFAEAYKVMNDINGGVYIQARFYSKDAPLYWNRSADRERKRKAKTVSAVECTT